VKIAELLTQLPQIERATNGHRNGSEESLESNPDTTVAGAPTDGA
jgi:hypothetical protein